MLLMHHYPRRRSLAAPNSLLLRRGVFHFRTRIFRLLYRRISLQSDNFVIGESGGIAKREPTTWPSHLNAMTAAKAPMKS
jgi:hypothetical protein